MKVLSIIEPFATLICQKKKYVETRSYKTSYRGELYIHASLTSIDDKNKELINLLDDKEVNCGYIICKCKLVDCIYMTSEYVEKVKRNNYNEYICGIYEEGRYAWVLDDIEPLDEKIRARGSLGIWNYYNEKEIMNLMDKIHYGWVDYNGNSYVDVDKNFSDKYRLQSPKEIIKSNLGVCWDQVELERYYFKNSVLKLETYFIVYYDNQKCPTHTFLIYEKNNKYYWFEHSWKKFKGIYEYDTKLDLLSDVKKKFTKIELNDNYDKDNLKIYNYTKPKYNISVDEFIKHCENGINIKA